MNIPEVLTSRSEKSKPQQINIHVSHRMGKPAICTGENKGADQLRSYCEADQRLCFRYMDSTIPLLSKSKISSLYVTIFCDCKAWFVSDLVGTLFTHRLMYKSKGNHALRVSNNYSGTKRTVQLQKCSMGPWHFELDLKKGGDQQHGCLCFCTKQKAGLFW